MYGAELFLPGLAGLRQEGGGTFEVIVKYSGDILFLEQQLGVAVELLDENYAIITLTRPQLTALYEFTEIEYIELPKIIVLNLRKTINDTCIAPVQQANPFGLTGKGVLVGIIDSGIDIAHPDFRNPDGTSRVLSLWDQAGLGTPPAGFASGAEYDNEQINAMIQNGRPFGGGPVMDPVGHGTGVAGIAAGNGRASGGVEKGAAPEASLAVVKLGRRGAESFARTTEIMRAIKYIYAKARALAMPLALNLSFGTNNGSHDGSSLFETYIGAMADKWKSVIVVASGNEGSAGHHYHGVIAQGDAQQIEFSVAPGIGSMYMILWKNFVDSFTFTLTAPNGQISSELGLNNPIMHMNTENTQVSAVYGQPTHYNGDQEIYFSFTAQNGGVANGMWVLTVKAQQVTDGRFDVWLPTTEEVSTGTAFFRPSAGITLTLPSTVEDVITVGGFNSTLGSAAEFSGRGYTRDNVYVKPDIVAPAVGIVSPSPGGGYGVFTGTSAAAPFVTGAAALMMEWGIIRNNDPFLYGQRIKAFLKKGARREGRIEYPNPIWGWGTLCLKNSMDLLVSYARSRGYM